VFDVVASDPEQAKLILPVYERIVSKRIRSAAYTESRAHTIDDYMTG